MDYTQSKYTWQGIEVTTTWIRTNELEKYSPITQVYGIIFNDKNEILVCRESSTGRWIIPGGHPEKGESLEETLKREVLEEVDVEVETIQPLGVFKVEFSDDPQKVIYQSRFVAKLKYINPQTPDPANGDTWERKFVPAEKISEYVKWGEAGDAMFKDAIELAKSIRLHYVSEHQDRF